ncbi:MAG: cysteine-rich CWC family protein [Bacteroidia bacterium]|nr:cysteine-rich CWC family protein [Bacteroidia bacterium]MCC7534442.1 cysteine-rich CWC family protein [Bacteroidia bacterium]MCZ2141036.1 cysteine-rich CWC family protein [Bacteroidia bacterium]
MKTEIEKYCPKCGKKFYCNSNDISKCFCNTVLLTQTTLLQLKENFTNCLCWECLNEISETHEYRTI